MRHSVRAAKPASHRCGVDTGSIPERGAVVKKQGDDLDKSGCSGYDLDAGSQDYAVYSACSN